MTPAEQLYALPEEIQSQLLVVAREAIGMSTDEKAFAAAMFATVARHFGERDLTEDNDAFIPGALMIGALGVLVKNAHTQASTNTKEHV